MTQVAEKEILLNGTQAVAYAAMYADVDVTAAYPIRPYTEVMDTISKLIADGQLDAEFIVAEGEHGQFEIVKHASLVGARTLVGTSGVGWLYAMEAIVVTATDRAPVVAVIGNRALDDPGAYGVEHNDALMVRDVGWLLVWVDTAQEAFDTALLAYRIGEDPRVLIPVGVSMDGGFLTHSEQIVRLPDKELVKSFLPPYDRGKLRVHPDNPISVAPQVNEDWVTEIRRQHDEGMERARTVIKEAYESFKKTFGRYPGTTRDITMPENPFVEPYMVEDADVVLVGMGTVSKPMKVAIKNMREKGIKAGMLRIRWFRPFPAEDVMKYLANAKVVCVVDRDYSLGSPFRGGVVYHEVRSSLYDLDERPKVLSFIGGLGGREITIQDVEKIIKIGVEQRDTPLTRHTYWVNVRGDPW
ncbi:MULTISPECIES: pyruvate ferredoxin oxidoreductase [Metallosphaera]|uniref:pyruvate ferredoxin oxidoreductase n=1 Tax=Metallosphaera TaxID=41980 RepID=UPI001F06BCE5|nr:pyruvate ferredoxin oxidoreductase [Metallosphaera sedula]MCH1770431.1 pyruvate ferredoxin oxidoreductase [Metallosphaera sedula]